MKFWMVAGVVLSAFTLDKTKGSTSQCDKNSFVKNCENLDNTTAKTILDALNVLYPYTTKATTETEAQKTQTTTEATELQPAAKATQNEKFTDELCSNIWSRCFDVKFAKPSVKNPNLAQSTTVSSRNPEKNFCDLINSVFNCSTKSLAKEIQAINYTNLLGNCEIQRIYNLALSEIALKIECVIQLWFNGKSNILKSDMFKDLIYIEKLLELVDVETMEVLSESNYMALLYKHSGTFSGMEFYANESQISVGGNHHNHNKMSFCLPKELALARNETFIFVTLQLPNKTFENNSEELFEQRLYGLSVGKREVSRLKELVNITVGDFAAQNKTPKCVFLDYSTQNFSSKGCKTLWDSDQNSVTCQCDHFTYFGVLLISPSISPEDQKILSYITSIGCGISLFGLVCTAFLLFTQRGKIEDSKKIHIHLVIAWILLNLHLLPSEIAAKSSAPGLCLYMALALHYSLLATFFWMALEGFHLYLLIVKVFNIYISRYMLKISVVGWGVPALIVLLPLPKTWIFYGETTLSPNSYMCYINNDILKYTTSMGVFSLMFLFNAFTIINITKYMFTARKTNSKKMNLNEVKKNVSTLMILMILLGLNGFSVFFSFGVLTTPGLYLLTICTSLQGVFIFLFIGLPLIKSKRSDASSSISTTMTEGR